jgi:hypothetical protein
MFAILYAVCQITKFQGGMESPEKLGYNKRNSEGN